MATITFAIYEALTSAEYDTATTATAVFDITDNDTASINTDVDGIVIAEQTSTLVGVYLTSEPVGNVVLNVYTSSTALLTATTVITETGTVMSNTSSITFTPSNWNLTQYAVVTAVNNDLVNGTQTATVYFSVYVPGTTATEYQTASTASTVYSVTDDDTASIITTVISSIIADDLQKHQLLPLRFLFSHRLQLV